jgi:hypothetical protein
MDVREVRPGVFYRFRDGVKPLLVRVECHACRSRTDLDYMLRDRLWRSVAPANGVLCILCLEDRLGRRTVLVDFKPGFAPGLMERRTAIVKTSIARCTHRLDHVDGVKTERCHCHITYAELLAYDRAQALLDPEVYQLDLLESKTHLETFIRRRP